jgi:hypothetical protein
MNNSRIFKNPQEIRKLVFGGKSVFTISRGESERFTFRVKRFGVSENYGLMVLTGSDNNTQYSYFATLVKGNFKWWNDSRNILTQQSPSVLWMKAFLKYVLKSHSLPDGIEFRNEGKCCRCGRRLTVPESIDRGIGPECVKFF